MKQCAICEKDIDYIKEPALLFIGKYGNRYEICSECEGLMDAFVAPQEGESKKEAADKLYAYMAGENIGEKSSEFLEFFAALFNEDSETAKEAEESLKEYREEEEKAQREAEALAEAALDKAEEEALSRVDETENEPTEEEFLNQEKKKTSITTKIIFLLLFLAVGGGALAYGIIKSTVFTIVIGAIIILLGIASVFAKD